MRLKFVFGIGPKGWSRVLFPEKHDIIDKNMFRIHKDMKKPSASDGWKPKTTFFASFQFICASKFCKKQAKTMKKPVSASLLVKIYSS